MKKAASTDKKRVFLNQVGRIAIIIIILLLVCGGGIYFAASKHIVKTAEGIKIYPKKGISFKDTYVDMTSLSFIQLRKHKEVVASMASKGDLQYVPGGPTLIKAIEAGYVVSKTITKFDNEYQISNSLKELARIGQDKYRKLDSQYNISGKMNKARKFAKEQASEFNKWLKKQ